MTYNIPSQITGDTWEGINSITFMKDGSALDLTGTTVEMGVTLSISSPNVLTLTTENSGISITSPELGIISIPPRIIDIPVSKYSWYLTLTFPTSAKKTYMMGLWSIIPNIPDVTYYERRNYN